MVGNANNPALNQQSNRILKEYREKADQIIRKMIGVLTQAHKKVDNIAYRDWRDKLITKTK